jgi:hypothetical protein
VLFGVIYLWRGVAMHHQAPPTAVMWPDSDGGMSVRWQENGFRAMPPNDAHVKWRIATFPVLFMAGAGIAMFALFRRSGGTGVARHAHTWWPAVLLLLLVPLAFLSFIGMSRVDRVASVSNYNVAERRAQEIHERVTRQQAELERRQAEIAQRTGELSSELEHRIENMEIHKLMDLVDAPRIMLPIPTPATIAQWAHLAAGEQPSGEGASAARTEEQSVHPDAEIKAEADASVQLIAAEDDVAPTAANTAKSAVAVSDDNNNQGGTTTRSVAPGRSAVIEESKQPRPSWVAQAPKRVGNVRRDVIVTDEYASREECEWVADRLLQLKTYEHLQRLVGKPLDANRMHAMRNEALSVEGHTPWFIHELDKAGITVDYIHQEIAREEYMEKVERSVGEMLKLYTQIEFTPGIDNDLRQHWQMSQRQERFAFVGLGASSVLGLLGFAWGLLKIDTWTKGYYTKRLFIGVPLAIVGLFGLYALLAEMGFDLPH